MAMVPKQTDKVRICTDLTELNKSVKREKQFLPSVKNTLGHLAGAKVFSKLKANAGFWQFPLSKESSLLTTFITPPLEFRSKCSFCHLSSFAEGELMDLFLAIHNCERCEHDP